MFKVCPSCHQEYQRWVELCSECSVPLALDQESSPAPSLPTAAEMVLLKVEGPWYLQELAELLQEGGISSRIDTDPPGTPNEGTKGATRAGSRGRATRLGIYVGADDLETANEIAQEFATSRLSDIPTTAANPDASACPACGEQISETAVSCAECGLEFPEAEIH